MTIGRRLTLWYGGILLVSLGVLAWVAHYEWTEQAHRFRNANEPGPVWHEVGEVVLFYGVTAAAMLLIGGGWLLRKSLAPIRMLTEQVERTHVQNLKQQLPRSGNGDELDRLTDVFNQMVARLDDSVSGIREFTLHASHELKTPLTLMRAQMETALRSENCPAGYRELFASQVDEIERLTKIVDGLTFLARADAGQITAPTERVRLDELVRDSFADAQVLAAPLGLSVELKRCDDVEVPGDRHRLRQLLLNLTSNAIKYNCPLGRVIVELRAKNGAAELVVKNSGPGISPERLPRVFERFFRGDPSHNSAVEGCGLGLSIAQAIVAAHRGSISLTSEPDKMTTVCVTLPLAQEQARGRAGSEPARQAVEAG